MNRICTALMLAISLGTSTAVFAGNPDRQGEAGAYELLLNPWARAAGLNGLVAPNVSGVEAMNFNPAGLTGTLGTQFGGAYTSYFTGSGMSLVGAGMAQGLGKGTLGISLMSVGFGNIDITTTSQPEGIGATFRPNFFNLGIAYGHRFSDRISCGLLFRFVSQSISNASATGATFDAGVQYTTGPKRNVKLGIALRNVGGKMRYRGEGFAFTSLAPTESYRLSVDQRSNGFEMPTILHIGASYDYYLADDQQRFTFIGNFVSNAFSSDQLGVATEYSFKETLFVRAGYKFDLNRLGGAADRAVGRNVHTGLSAGLGMQFSFNKEADRRFSLDYAYQPTNPFSGNHTVGLKIDL